jgi:hypothetical protein
MKNRVWRRKLKQFHQYMTEALNYIVYLEEINTII